MIFLRDDQLLLDAAIEAAYDAGKKVLELYNGNYWIEKKVDDSPVTKADHLSEEVIIEKLPNENIDVVAEESGVQSEGSDLCWVIDPLDGTKDFLQHTDEFSVMIGLLKEGSPHLGVVYSPAQKELLYATRGEGAYLKSGGSKSALSVSEVTDLSSYKMVISRNHFREEDRAIAEELEICDFRPVGSVGVKYSTLAKGAADICIYSTDALGPWDCCAPHIILEEAGGEVMNLKGDVPTYDLESEKMKNGFVGTNGKNGGKIKEILRNHV